MSRSGNVRFKSVHCLMLCVLLTAALVFSGCGGTVDGSGDSSVSDSADAPGAGGGSGTESTDPAGINADAPGAGVGSGADPAADSGADLAGSTAKESSGQDAAEEDGLPEELLISAAPEAEQEIQEIVAKPAGRKGTLPEIYDPNPAYDKYALVEYAIEDIGAEFTATVSAEDDDSEYEVHCNLGRTEQVVILDMDYSVVYDRTGEMGSDAPLIVQMAVEENDWRSIGE